MGQARNRLRRTRRGTSPFVLPVRPARPPAPLETLDHFWHPQRFGVRLAPDSFRRLLHETFPTIEVTWQPLSGRWLVWQREPTMQHPLCRGWSLKFVWERPSDQSYKPLDERLLAAIYSRSYLKQFPHARNPVRAYYQRVASEIERDRAAQRQKTDDETQAIRRDFLQYRRIKNIGRGSKFALHHDGSVVPSSGERAWHSERERYL